MYVLHLHYITYILHISATENKKQNNYADQSNRDYYEKRENEPIHDEENDMEIVVTSLEHKILQDYNEYLV